MDRDAIRREAALIILGSIAPATVIRNEMGRPKGPHCARVHNLYFVALAAQVE